jgi:hypothetical protein
LGGKRRISVEEKEEVNERIDFWASAAEVEVERRLVAEADATKEAEETTAIFERILVRILVFLFQGLEIRVGSELRQRGSSWRVGWLCTGACRGREAENRDRGG